MEMRRAFIGFVLLMIANSFFVPQTHADAKDDKFRDKIVGSWSEGKSPFAVATFMKGGRYEGKMYESPQKQQIMVVVTGKWWIEDGKLYNTVKKVEPQILPAMNGTSIDVIVDISDDRMTLIDHRGIEYTKAKVD